MKKIILSTILAAIVIAGYSQTKKAGIAFFSSIKPQVTFYGMNPPRASDATKIHFSHGKSFSDGRLFDTLKTKIQSVLPQLGFRFIPEDSIITTENYKNLVKKNAVDKTPNHILKSGYAYPANFALLFSNGTNDPDIMIEVMGYYELNNETDNSFSGAGKTITNLRLYLTIVGYDNKKKKVFVFKTKNVDFKSTAFRVAISPSNTSNWGYEITEDISKKQIDCIVDAFKQIDEDLPKQIEKVTKFYSK